MGLSGCNVTGQSCSRCSVSISAPSWARSCFSDGVQWGSWVGEAGHPNPQGVPAGGDYWPLPEASSSNGIRVSKGLGWADPKGRAVMLPLTPSADLVPRLFTGFSGQFTHKAQQNTA